MDITGSGKMARVREMMDRNDLDAIVVRAPDNVLYLTNYWTMKGYDLAIFPVKVSLHFW